MDYVNLKGNGIPRTNTFTAYLGTPCMGILFEKKHDKDHVPCSVSVLAFCNNDVYVTYITYT